MYITVISKGAEKEKMDRKHIFKSNDLISGQQWRNRPMDKVGGEKGKGEMDGESNIEIYNTMCKAKLMGICCMAQGTQTGSVTG